MPFILLIVMVIVSFVLGYGFRYLHEEWLGRHMLEEIENLRNAAAKMNSDARNNLRLSQNGMHGANRLSD